MLLAAAVFAAPALPVPEAFAAGTAMVAPDRPAPYVIITRDGHRIDAMEKPEVGEGRARIRLAPRGTLSFYPADSIDWGATEKFNAPLPAPEAASAAAAGAKVAPEPAPVEPGKVIEMKIIGSARPVAAAATAGEAPAALAPAVPSDPNEVAALLATLAREFANLKKIQQDLSDSRTKLEQEVSSLEVRAAKEAPVGGIQAYESPTRKAIDRARADLQALAERLSPVETRLNEIRVRIVELGGAAD